MKVKFFGVRGMIIWYITGLNLSAMWCMTAFLEKLLRQTFIWDLGCEACVKLLYGTWGVRLASNFYMGLGV